MYVNYSKSLGNDFIRRFFLPSSANALKGTVPSKKTKSRVLRNILANSVERIAFQSWDQTVPVVDYFRDKRS